jgi:restriction system protein
VSQPRRRIPRPNCLSMIGCLAIVAATVLVIVRGVILWITGHPFIIGGIVLLAGVGAAGGWHVPNLADRRTRRGPAADLLSLDPDQFEEYVAALCWRDGCTNVRVVGGSGDLGADVLATTPTGRRVLVQCKRYAVDRRVGSPAVQQISGTYQVVHGAELAIVVTTASFTEAAVDYARRAGIRLVDGRELAAWAAEEVLPPWGGERMMGA